jgi:hypothetical protein
LIERDSSLSKVTSYAPPFDRCLSLLYSLQSILGFAPCHRSMPEQGFNIPAAAHHVKDQHVLIFKSVDDDVLA